MAEWTRMWEDEQTTDALAWRGFLFGTQWSSRETKVPRIKADHNKLQQLKSYILHQALPTMKANWLPSRYAVRLDAV